MEIDCTIVCNQLLCVLLTLGNCYHVKLAFNAYTMYKRLHVFLNVLSYDDASMIRYAAASLAL